MDSNLDNPFVCISAQELDKGITNASNIEEAIAKYHHNGFVILENAIHHTGFHKSNCEELKTKIYHDSALKRMDHDLVYNQGVEKTNFSMPLPLMEDFLWEDVWANKHAVAIMENLIGPRPKLAFASINISLPTKKPLSRQAVHIDTPTPTPSYPLCIQVSIYLDTVHSCNGSTELWPRSHLVNSPSTYIPSGRGWVKPAVFNKAAKKNPPQQYTIPRGSILLRDVRTWHAGMVNLTKLPRIMLNFHYFPQWFKTQMGVTLPLDCKPIAESWTHVDAISATKFIKGPIDYLSRDFEKFWILNYTQDPKETLEAVRARSDLEHGRVPNADIEVTTKHYWVEPRKSGRKRKFEVDEQEAKHPHKGFLDMLEQVMVDNQHLPSKGDSCSEPDTPGRMGLRIN